MNLTLVLASQSPRRKELLSQLGYEFTTQAADIDESIVDNESPQSYVERLARQKAQVVSQLLVANNNYHTAATYPVVLGSDTSVVFNQQILGKPIDLIDAKRMLTLLSGNKHQVYTAVVACQGNKLATKLAITEVEFKSLSAIEIDNYWHTGEPKDKAGAYGIQGIAGQFVTSINGSYSAVVGLPLVETGALLTEFGLPPVLQRVFVAK